MIKLLVKVAELVTSTRTGIQAFVSCFPIHILAQVPVGANRFFSLEVEWIFLELQITVDKINTIWETKDTNVEDQQKPRSIF